MRRFTVRRSRLWTACVVGLLGLLLAAPVAAEEEEKADGEAVLAVGRAVAPSCVVVEIWLRYDKGEPPNGFNAGAGYLQNLLVERRPWTTSGFVIAADRVVMPDVQIHPRFVDRIEVRSGAQTVKATPLAWYQDNDAVLLALEAPLEDAVPLEFDATREGPYFAAYHGRYDTAWAVTVTKTFGRPFLYTDGPERFGTWAGSVITDAAGGAVGIVMHDEVRMDGPWRGSPAGWAQHDRSAYAAMLSRLEDDAKAGLLHVHLRFRSPKQEEGGGGFFPGRNRGEEAATDLYVPALLVDATRLLVLASLEPESTARLEGIEILSRGEERPAATFAGSLEDYGAFVANLDAPLEGTLALSDRPIRDYEEQLLLLARLDLQGERRTWYFEHARVHEFELSWEEQVVVQAQGAGDGRYLFDVEGRLAAFPVIRRTPQDERQRWRRPEPVMLPAVYLRPVLADLEAHVDSNNVPLSAEDEMRLAWLGLELQALDEELARLNEVSHLTRDGQTGAIAAYVYPDSPAARAGIVPGDILIRIQAPDRPKPIEVTAGGDPFGGFFDAMPAEVRDQLRGQMPSVQPWPSVDNDLNRALTELGFGKPFTLMIFRDGEVESFDLVVEQGPRHFDAATPHEDEDLGLTVKDLTYEARRYYQLDADAPGVVVSKVESGRKAAVAGLQPFEIITHVNEVPVTDIAAFAAALDAEGELRLKVRQKLRERIVNIER